MRCGAPVLWVRSARGKNLPLDPEPVNDPERGGFVLVDEVAHYVQAGKRAGILADGQEIWEAHFATCPALTREALVKDAAKLAHRLAETLDEIARNGSEP